ncbi:MAG TPA: TldD/PmbA family protein, partial [Gemmatimonadaceae bacterium]|nr:TldD/PmbA family protein [Gemmatimonadaceae bacterium]
MSAPKRLWNPGAAPGENVLSSAEAEQIVEQVVKLSKADAVEVNFSASRTGNTRFAANQMSTAGVVENRQLVVQSSFGPKSAVVTTDDFSPESLERAVR